MDNTQLEAPDGTWFLFADWQGMTRITLPGDKVKTDANLDRPHEEMPLVRRASGVVRSTYQVDVEPTALKKLAPEARCTSTYSSPDPLGGPDLELSADGSSVKVRGVTLALTPSGDRLSLGATDDAGFITMSYALERNGAVLVFGSVSKAAHFGLVLRADDGSPRVAFCRALSLFPGRRAPNAWRVGASTWLADRDAVSDTAWLVELDDAGNVLSEAHTPAVAGPWVHDGRIFWQADEGTVSEGARLGVAEKTFDLGADHQGRGTLLRLSGRRLFLPWHRTSLLDLEPAKKGKGELSRKHKASDEPLYRAAERLVRVVTEHLRRRGQSAQWVGCTRRGKTLEPRVVLNGPVDALTWALETSLRDGGRALLAPHGVSAVSVSGGTAIDQALAASLSADDVRAHVAMLDAAGLSRASGLPALFSLASQAVRRKVAVPWSREVEAVALSAVASGLRGETKGELTPLTPEHLAALVPLLREPSALLRAGIPAGAASFVAFAGQRLLGAEAAAPVRAALTALNASFDREVQEALDALA